MAKKKTRRVSSRRPSSPAAARRKRPAIIKPRPIHSHMPKLEAMFEDNPADFSGALRLAEAYGQAQQEENIVDVLQRFEPQYPMADTSQRATYDRLLAIGFAHQNRYIEAESVVNRALQAGDESLDLYYVLAYIKLTLHEYEDVIEACSQFLALVNAINDGTVTTTDFAATRGHISQLYNFLATAFKETDRSAEAAEAYERSISFDQGNSLPYLNLAGLYNSQKDVTRAREVVQRGLKNCRQVQELRMLEESFKQSATVSACMIVKNEEEMLPDCLASIRNWVDEIIIVDTGSSDRTVEIAREYGARVFFQEWEGNFSKHRNYSLEQAAGDWIFIIDADERFVAEDLKVLRPLLNSDDLDVLSVNVYNVYQGSEERTTFLPSIRLWRRKHNLRYEGIVHNVLQVPKHLTTHRVAARIRHLGYDLTAEKMDKKAERTMALLEKQLQEKPDNAFALFNYAQLLAGRRAEDMTRHADRILDMAERAVKLTSPTDKKSRHIHLMCLNHLAWTNFFVERFDLAEKHARRALEIKKDYLDPLLLLGHIAAKQAQFGDARRLYEDYLDAQAKYDADSETENLILAHVDSRVNALYGLAMIAEVDKDWVSAKRYYQQTLAIDPQFLEANGALGRILLGEGDIQGAERCFLAQADSGVYSRVSLLGLGRIAENKRDWAASKEWYRKILGHDRDDAEAAGRLATVLREMGDENEAVALLKRVGSGSAAQSRQTRHDVAASLFAMGQYQEAAEAYQLLLEERATSEGYNDLGNCYFKLDEFDTASECYRKAIDIQPVTSAAYRNLGVCELRLQRKPEAAQAFELYLNREPYAEDVLRVLADLHFSQGEYARSLTLFERLLTAHPNDVGVLIRLSDCYLNMGHEDSAVVGYRRALVVDPGNRPAQERLNEILQPAGQA